MYKLKLENVRVYECSGYEGPDHVAADIMLPNGKNRGTVKTTISINVKAGTGKSYCLKHFKIMPKMCKSFPVSNPD